MRIILGIGLACTVLLCACSNDRNRGKYEGYKSAAAAMPAPAPMENSEQEKADSVSYEESTNAVSATAKPAPGAYSAPALDKKLIFTADFKCQVTQVFTTVKQLETLVKNLNGTVQESNMENIVGETKNIYKEDSLRQYHTYSTVATLSLRIPAQHFDSVIHAIPAMVAFIESRTIKESDVSLQYYASKVKSESRKRRLEELKNTKIDKKKALELEEYRDGMEDDKMNADIQNMGLLSDVAYATVTVRFTQPQQVYVRTVLNPESLSDDNFWGNCKKALSDGFEIIRYSVLAVCTMWPLLFFVAAMVIAFRLRKKKRKERLAAQNTEQNPA